MLSVVSRRERSRQWGRDSVLSLVTRCPHDTSVCLLQSPVLGSCSLHSFSPVPCSPALQSSPSTPVGDVIVESVVSTCFSNDYPFPSGGLAVTPSSEQLSPAFLMLISDQFHSINYNLTIQGAKVTPSLVSLWSQCGEKVSCLFLYSHCSLYLLCLCKSAASFKPTSHITSIRCYSLLLMYNVLCSNYYVVCMLRTGLTHDFLWLLFFYFFFF